MLKYISKIKIKFSPFNPTSGPAKSFLNEIYTDRNLDSNPKCKIDTEIASKFDTTPSIAVTFKDGHEINIKSDKMKIEDVRYAIKKHIYKLSLIEHSSSN